LPAPWSASVSVPCRLLQFAAAVLVELAVARQDVQFLQQFDRLAGAQHIG